MFATSVGLVAGLLLLPLCVLGQTSRNCTGPDSIHLIALRGHSFYGDPDPSAWNVLIPFRELVLAQIPQSDAVALPYNAQDPNTFTGALNGTILLTEYIVDYVRSCPKSYIAVLGFSEGAIPTFDTFCGGSEVGTVPTLPLLGSYAANVISIIGWGDPTRTGFVSWNTGTCPQQYSGVSPRVGALNCLPFSQSMQNVCDTGDQLCCALGPLKNNAHDLYIQKYSQAGVDYIKARLAAQKNKPSKPNPLLGFINGLFGGRTRKHNT